MTIDVALAAMRRTHAAVARSLARHRWLPPVFFPCAALAVQLLFEQQLEHARFLLFYPAVFFSAWASGFAGGLTATLICALFEWQFLVPSPRVDPSEMVWRQSMFLVMSLVFSVFHERLKRATRRVEQAYHELERNSETRFRSLIEHSRDCISLRDAENRILYVSPTVTLVEGYAPEELIGTVGFERNHPDDLPGLLRLREEALARPGVALPVVARRRHKDGRWIWVEGFVTNLLDVPAVRAIVVNYQDITQRRERDLLTARLAAIVASSEDAIIGEDLHSLVTSWNEGAERIFGYAACEMLGQHAARLIPRDRLEEEERILERILAGERVDHFETVRLRRDGGLVDVSVTASAIKDPAGQTVGVSTVARNISARKQVEQEVRRLNQDLEQRVLDRTRELLAAKDRAEAADRHKSEFLANMSHELRTPLNAVIGFSALLFKEKVGSLSAEQREYVGDILSSAKHLLQMINDVLDLAKVESGKMEFRPESVDLSQLIDGAIEVVHELAMAKSIQVVMAVDEEVAQVVVDASRVKQILFNYLSNAIKFSHEHGRVDVKVAAEGERMFRIDVVDSGIGIAEEDLGRLFVEFQQLDGTMTKIHQGTGLGLALTRRLAEGHGGQVAVRSASGRGSTFSAILPRFPERRRSASAMV